MTPSEMGRKGGKATAAKLTPEERRARASKGGSASWASLTKAQRKERALRGKATREAREAGIKAGARLAENFVNAGAGVKPFNLEDQRYPGGNMPDLQTLALLACDRPPTPPVPKNQAERLSAGFCRRCLTPRHVENGKTNALWCTEHLKQQREFDRLSWANRHGKGES